MSKDALYYMKREAAERELAESATDPRVRAVHAALAERYSELVNGVQMPAAASAQSAH